MEKTPEHLLHALPKNEPTVPQLFLSSEKLEWDDLKIFAYHEPKQIEGWVAPALSDPVLVLLTHGKMLMEQRAKDSWKTFPVHQHDLFLKPSASFSQEMRWKSISQEPMQTVHVHLSNALVARVAEEAADCDAAHLTLVERTAFQDPLLTQIILAFKRELEEPKTLSKLYLQSATQLLVVHLLRFYTDTPVKVEEPSYQLTPRQIRQVTDFILAHLDQELSLPILAQQANFSPYHFTRIFHQTIGESPHQFVMRQRVERAKQLLKEAKRPLAHIALECGFANQSHLIRTFKHHVGTTPALYRKNS